MKPPYARDLGTHVYNGRTLHFWAVDATYIRRNYPRGIEFTMGGHHYVYKWIPRGEIWLDSALPIDELQYTARHEEEEEYLMAVKRVSYEYAHHVANQVEAVERRANKPSIHFVLF